MKNPLGNLSSTLWLLLAAAFLGVSFHGEGLSILALFALTILGYLIASCGLKLVPTIAAGVIFQLAGVDWMRHCYSSPAVTEGRFQNWLWLGLLFGGILPLILWLTTFLHRRGWALWLALPVAWTTGDFVRYQVGRPITGDPYPWLTLGLSQTDNLIPCQVADLGGVWAVGFVMLILTATISQLVFTRRLPLLPLFLLLMVLVYCQTRMVSSPCSSGPRITLMPGSDRRVPPTAQMVLWPETALRGHQILDTPAVLLQGCYREVDGASFNSIAVIHKGSTEFYDKCRLVPWSESAPWGGKALFVAGTSPGIFQIDDYEFGTAICYDICFTEFMRGMAKTQFVAVAANEASDPTRVLAHQLLAHTRMRAIEMRRSIVRNANGGYSGLVDGSGRFTPYETRGEAVTTHAIPLDKRLSPYAQLGDWLPIGCVLLVVLSGLHAIADRARPQQTDHPNHSTPEPC